jgi:hypothetical protein
MVKVVTAAAGIEAWLCATVVQKVDTMAMS